jgi:predicted transcriptional regulator
MKRVSARLPDAALAKLDSFASDNGVTRSAALKAFIERKPPAQGRAPSGELADRAELLELLTERARDGHVTAMKTLLEEYRRDGNENTAPIQSKLDELAKKRAARGS